MLDHETWGLGWTPTCYSVDPESAWPIFWWFYMERRAWELRSVSVPYFSSLLCHATFECKNWYILHLWMFGLSFSRFCGNTLACPVCVGFFPSKHADRNKSQLGNCCEWIQRKELTCRWEHTAGARSQFYISPTQTLWTFQLSPFLTWFFS